MDLSSSVLAAFVSPALFAGGAAAVAAPILIHLLARRRFKRIRWAAIDFLLHAQRHNKRRIRMEEWILLALRCLAVLLLALMVARPFIKPSGFIAGWSGADRTEHIFVLDDSFSMAYQASTGTSFDRAKQAVQQLIETIREETPDDTVTVLRMTAEDTPVDSGTYLDDTQSQQLLARLEALSPTQQSIDAGRVVEGVADILGRNPELLSAAVYIISDFQRKDWIADIARSPDSEDDDGGILSPLKDWTKDDRALRVVLIDIGDERPRNSAITDLTIKSGRIVAGGNAVLRAELANYSEVELEGAELLVTLGNLSQPVNKAPSISPHQHTTLDLDVEFLRPGYEGIRLELPPDSLPIDNARYAATEVVNAVRVLIVNGEPSSDSFNDETTFLSTALRPEGEVFSGYELVIVDEVQFEEANLPLYHVVVMANVYRISEPMREDLERFVSRGGGLVLFLGDQVDAQLYTSSLYRNGEGLLPGSLTEVLSASDTAHLVVSDRLHPVMRGISQVGDPLGIGHIPFFKYFGCEPYLAEDSADSLGAPGMGEGVAVGRSARVIAHFDDDLETPAVVERAFGNGRVVLVTTSADKEWNHWPDHPTFLPIVMELVRYVTPSGDQEDTFTVGLPMRLPIDLTIYEPDALIRTPAYPAEQEVSVSAIVNEDGEGFSLVWEHTETAGIYQVVLRSREGGQHVKLVAVNLDAGESDLSTASEDELRKSMSGMPVEYVRGLDKLGTISGEARTELWRICLLAVMAVLMCEQILAWTWGRRR